MLDARENPEKIAAGGLPTFSRCRAPGKADGPPAPGTARGRGILSGSHAIPPQERVRLDVVHPPGLGEPDHLPAGDPERKWRRRGRWLDAITLPTGQAGPATLAGSDAVMLLDDAFALAEWGLASPCPRVQAMAARQLRALEMIRTARTDADRRSISLGRELGIQPPAGKSPGFALALDDRNRLLVHVWRTAPAFRDLPARKAAPMICAAFSRYLASAAWQADKGRDRAPQGAEPMPTFWRLARLGRDDTARPPRPGLSVVMPRPDTLARLLAAAE